MSNLFVDAEQKVFAGSYPLMMSPQPETDYTPRSEAEEEICRGMQLLSEGQREEGRKCLESAWAMGSMWAGELLSYGYTSNWFSENDYPRAWQILDTMQRKGDAMAMNNIATMYESGFGCKQSLRWAKFWFEKAVANGCVYAMVNLANLLTLGPNKYRDYERAVQLLKSAMEKGDPEAFNMMGVSYWKGRGVPKDYDKAFEHYQIAYEKGAGPVSAYNLGCCYYFGEGTAKDLEKAEALFKEATDGGFPVNDCLDRR